MSFSFLKYQMLSLWPIPSLRIPSMFDFIAHIVMIKNKCNNQLALYI